MFPSNPFYFLQKSQLHIANISEANLWAELSSNKLEIILSSLNLKFTVVLGKGTKASH